MKSFTPAEQNDLAVRAKAGDRKAVADLLAFCERDVLAIVAKWRCSEAEREDLAQVARMAILESAIRTFNPTKGYQFRFWAAQWARTEVKRARNIGSSMVVVNVRTAGADVSLDAPTVDGEAPRWNDMLEDETPGPEEYAIAGSNTERVREVMERIISTLRTDADKQYDRVALCRDLVYKRLLAETPVTLATVADWHGLSRQACRNIELTILKRARAALLGA